MLRSITGGFRYFDWQSPLIHLIFAIAIGLVATGANRVIRTRRPHERSAIRSARIASAISLAAAGLAQVDALIVLVYFLIASFISLTVSAYAAARAARAWKTP
jgi:phage shock protein PspC (stress-responsive transcriptional regulator)